MFDQFKLGVIYLEEFVYLFEMEQLNLNVGFAKGILKWNLQKEQKPESLGWSTLNQ